MCINIADIAYCVHDIHGNVFIKADKAVLIEAELTKVNTTNAILVLEMIHNCFM